MVCGAPLATRQRNRVVRALGSRASYAAIPGSSDCCPESISICFADGWLTTFETYAIPSAIGRIKYGPSDTAYSLVPALQLEIHQ